VENPRRSAVTGEDPSINRKCDVRLNTKELIDRIFKEPGIKFELTEFENLGKPIHDILAIYPKTSATGKEAARPSIT
jgi:hypothetical protein